MWMMRGAALAGVIALTFALPARGQDLPALSDIVAELATLDPAVAGELAFLQGDPAVVAPLVETYRTKARVTQEALATLAEAEDAHFVTVGTYGGRSSRDIEAELATIDPEAGEDRERLEAALEQAQAFERNIAEAEGRVAAAQAIYEAARLEEDAALDALTGRMLLSGQARLSLERLVGL